MCFMQVKSLQTESAQMVVFPLTLQRQYVIPGQAALSRILTTSASLAKSDLMHKKMTNDDDT